MSGPSLVQPSPVISSRLAHLDIAHHTRVTCCSVDRVVHWDVYNEIFQSHFYEELTGDIHISYKMYEETHKYDPGVKLFLNEQWAVSTGMITEVSLYKVVSTSPVGNGVT